MSSLNQNVIRHKIGLLNLATELGNVSKACKVMGLSRDTFYRYQNAVAEGGVEALFDGNRRKPNPKNRVEEATETAVLAYATERLEAIPGLRILGQAREKASVISFVLEGIHPHDVGSILDHEGIVVRAGHHCAQPVMQRLGVPATTRASSAEGISTDANNTPLSCTALLHPQFGELI